MQQQHRATAAARKGSSPPQSRGRHRPTALCTATPPASLPAGNAHFRAGEYEHACAAYTAALKEEPDAALYSNRSAARLKLGQAAAALADAQEAVRLRPSWDKAHFRQGCALEELGQLQDVR